jgi:predicted MPP superfamily phosphohydrolase
MQFRVLIFLLILFAIDVYVFQGVKLLTHHKSVNTQKAITIMYWSVAAVCFLIVLLGNFINWHTWPKALRTYSFALIVNIYFSKLFVVLFLLIDDILRLFRLAGTYVSQLFSNPSSANPKEGITRFEFLSRIGFLIGAIPFFSMIYGMMDGAYRYRVRKVSVPFENLPSAFDGLKIIQISDLHTGSFMGINHLEKAVELILRQRADLIFFTGDLVNDLHTEALEFENTLKKITAPLGVFSILGNHDYGDYYHWHSIDDKTSNLDKLKAFQRELGWKLLLNEHTFIEKQGEKIGLIGVENWSARLNFKKYGDMLVATAGMLPSSFNILLSHDPSHWKAEIIEKYPYVDLTLSGHTHGFQFGIEIPGFKWSPVQYMYKEWADLYQDKKQFLYVNRGLGFLGYPGRVGIMPEITLFELHKA